MFCSPDTPSGANKKNKRTAKTHIARPFSFGELIEYLLRCSMSCNSVGRQRLAPGISPVQPIKPGSHLKITEANLCEHGATAPSSSRATCSVRPGLKREKM